MFIECVTLLSFASLARSQTSMCDQTPVLATVRTPSTIDQELFHLAILNAGQLGDKKYLYTPDQTYVLAITALNSTRPFRWFMITAEDPDMDDGSFEFGSMNVDVGTLKTLDTQSRYSERCYSSVENVDNSEKTKVEIHWVSPKQSNVNQTIRIRGMVAETNERWYTGDNLTVMLFKDNHKPKDSPPYEPSPICNLCSEARYEVIFQGKWSRVAHPRHYPTKPDINGYTHMVGASHSYNYTMWHQGVKASPGLRQLVEEANSTALEREIVLEMAEEKGTRTLIRGKRRHHPFMSEPSHSLFRVDRHHHLFSLVVGLRPSPDWFLGTSNFELCTEFGWLNNSRIPLYPWDAGTMDGVSYESDTSPTMENVERVEVGSFDEKSPFFQMNLNDLQPFAYLQVNRLDVYPLVGADCSETKEEEEEESNQSDDVNEEETQELPEEPVVAESRQKLDWDRGNCYLGDWGDWSPCTPNKGGCGNGFRTRTRRRNNSKANYDYQKDPQYQHLLQKEYNCDGVPEKQLVQYQSCIVEC